MHSGASGVACLERVFGPLDLLRRTRRNADTIRGAAPNVTIKPAAAVHVGARPYHRIGIVESNRQTHGPLRPKRLLSDRAAAPVQD